MFHKSQDDFYNRKNVTCSTAKYTYCEQSIFSFLGVIEWGNFSFNIFNVNRKNKENFCSMI